MNQFAQQRTCDRRTAMRDKPLISRVGTTVFSRYKEMHSTWASVAFFAALVLYCFARCIAVSRLTGFDGVSTLVQVLINIVIVILLCKIVLLTVYKPLEVMVFAAVILTGLLAFFLSGANTFFIFSLFIVAVKGINARMVCITVLCVVGFCLVAVIFLSLVGVLENETMAGVDRILGIDIARHRFGFTHPNYVGQLSLAIFFCYLYLRYKKFGILDVIGCVVGIILLYFVVSTKTTAFLIAVGVALVLLSKVLGWKRILILCAVVGCLSIFAGIYFAWIYDPNNGFLEGINYLLSGRLSYAHSFLTEYPVLPFGQELELIGDEKAARLNVAPRILDNAYINLLLRYGLISLVIALVAYGLAFAQAARKRSVVLVITLALMLMLGNSEAWFFNLNGIAVLCIAFGVQPGSNHKIEKSLGDSQITSSRNYPHDSQNARSRNRSEESRQPENNYPAVSAPVPQPTAQIKSSRSA